jgi:hypothetical protein
LRVTHLVKRAPQAALLVAALAGWAACRPCDCQTFPDDTGVTPDPDDDGRDRFRPGRMAVEGAFAFDPDTGRAVGWVDRDTPREVAIFVRMTDDRYLGTADERHRCRMRLAPTGPLQARVESFLFTFGGADPERAYRHLLVTLEPGAFDVVDAPYDTPAGERVRGCIEVEDDPERGFSLRFADGSARAWARDLAWGVGVGELAPVVHDDLLAMPDTSYLRELLDFGFAGGGSVRVAGPQHDFVAPIGLSLATTLDEDRYVVYDRGVPRLLRAETFAPLGADDTPPAALYQIAPMYAITFE